MGETRKPSSSSSLEQDDQFKPGAPLIRRYSISSSSSRLELSKHSLAAEVQRLNDKVNVHERVERDSSWEHFKQNDLSFVFRLQEMAIPKSKYEEDVRVGL